MKTYVNMERAGVVIFMTILMIGISNVECRVCTRMTLQKKVVTQSYYGECHQSYEARCTWFSARRCTFNETLPCMKEHNKTVTIYRIVEDCCPGYHPVNKDKSRLKCARGPGGKGEDRGPAEPGSPETVTVNYEDDDKLHRHDQSADEDDGDFLGISHGVYAGIICGILFVACVAMLIALHYRKRRQRQAKMSTLDQEHNVARKPMIPLNTLESPPTADT